MRNRPQTARARRRAARWGSGLAATALLASALGVAPAAADEVEELGRGATPESKIKEVDGALSGAEVDVVAGRYLVQLAGDPVVDGGSAARIASAQEALLAEVDGLSSGFEVTREFDRLWNGLSVEASGSDVVALASSSRVLAIYPVTAIEAPEPVTGTPVTDVPRMGPNDTTSNSMIGADVLQAEGITGEGIRVGIIDTGVDYDHPDLGGTGEPDGSFPTERVPFGYDFVGDDYNADPSDPAYQPRPAADADPDDCNGHGTHVAGIVGADPATDDGVLGVAPDVTFGAYRVFGCEGSTESDIMLAAMELAYDDGMDVVNMSIGSAFTTWPEYPTAVASDGLVRAGVVVDASIGNSGAEGLYSAGAPGVGRETVGTASFDNTFVTGRTFTRTPDEAAIGFLDATGAPEAPTEGSSPITVLGPPGSAPGQACPADGPIEADLTGQVALVERGVCSFHEKAVQVQDAGAAGMVLYNNAPGIINPTVEGPTPIEIPVVSILAADGVSTIELAETEDVGLTWTDDVGTLPNPTGGLISAFSSYGLAAYLEVKPDLGAPGGSIFATYPLESGGYATLSGTSMAAPHVAGASALYLQQYPDATPAQIELAFQNTAEPKAWSGNPGLGLLDHVQRQGAGLLRVDLASQSEHSVEPGLWALGQSLDDAATEGTLTLSNDSDSDVTWDIEHVPAVATSGTIVPTFTDAAGSYEGPDTATVPAGESLEVDVAVTPPTDVADTTVYNGYLTLTAEGQSPLRVGYAGFVGDYHAVDVLTPTANDLPQLASLTECDILVDDECTAGGAWEPQPEGASFTMAEGDVPTVLAHLEHQTPRLEMRAYHANPDGTRGEPVGGGEGSVLLEEYVGRSATPDDFRALVWDGTYTDADGVVTPAEAGDYLLVLTADHPVAFNDEREPTEQDTFETPVFTIDAPKELPTAPLTVERFEGENRYATASAISSQNHEPGVETVYVANGMNYPDALTAGARAGEESVPVLLVNTPEGRLTGPTTLELDRLQPQSITVVGGSTAVPGELLTQLAQYTDGAVTRIEGRDRYGTAVQLAAGSGAQDTVYLATGQDYPDALTSAALAGRDGAPVLLTRSNALPNVTAQALTDLETSSVVVLGGDEAVEPAVYDELEALGITDVETLEGPERYGTAASVAGQYEPGVSSVYLATGQDYPDALTGAALAGREEGPVLLGKTGAGDVPASTLEQINRLRPQHIYLLGGDSALSYDMEEFLEALEYTD